MDRLKEIFTELVEINSVSGNEEKLIKYLTPLFVKLGFKVEVDDAKNFFAKNFEGEGINPFLLSGHTDTTESTDNIKLVQDGNIIKTDRTTILGADNKAAIAEILFALETLKVEEIRDLEILLSSGEEEGLKGIKKFDLSHLSSKNALTLDCCREFGNVVETAPAAYILTLTINGQARHGSEANSGINSIEIAAKGISTFKTDFENIIYNFGLIQGGTTPNTVPEKTQITLSFRSFSESESQTFISTIESHFKKVSNEAGAEFSFDIYEVGSTYQHSKQSDFFKQVLEETAKIESNVKVIKSFGLTDANVLNQSGITAIEVGYGIKNPHSKQEEADLGEMQKTVDFLVKFLKK